MPQGYYTLEEAAQILKLSPEELRQKARKDEIRSFQDRGTLRFRIEDIQELSRIQSGSSDPELVLGEPSVPRSADSPAPKTPPRNKEESQDVFGFDLGNDDVDFGIDLGEQSSASKKSNAKSPKPGSDSDVKLVGDDSDDFALSVDSDPGAKKDIPSDDHQVKRDTEVKLPGKSDAKKKEEPATPNVSSKPNSPHMDSGVRLVSMDSDSDVKIVSDSSDEISLGEMPPPSAADSDVRLEEPSSPRPSTDDEMRKTEEIRLDDVNDAALSIDGPRTPQAKVKRKDGVPSLNEESPFELSDDGDTPSLKESSGEDVSDSSDFELTAAADSDSDSDPDLMLSDSSDDFSLELPDDSNGEVSLELSDSADLQGPGSGINLDNPVDSGISLEDSSAEPDFELSLDEATPKPVAASNEMDSDSEFELSLDLDDSGVGFQGDSDSEFELTLDDSGELDALDKAQAKTDDPDIFETDFEVPALDEESGSQVAVLETDLDSSDFELALDDSELSLDDDSASQVVALDEEDADAGAETLQSSEEPQIDVLEEDELVLDEDDIDVDSEGFDDIDQEAAEEEVRVREVIVKEKVANPAWGPLPVIIMLPCVVLMAVVGLMGFELLQSASGHSEPGFITKALSDLIIKK